MSAIGDAVRAVKEALLLAEDVRRLGDAMKSAAQELREHDRRITRLEAQWETALHLSGHQSRKRLRGLRKMTCTTWASSVTCSRGQLGGIPRAIGDPAAAPE